MFFKKKLNPVKLSDSDTYMNLKITFYIFLLIPLCSFAILNAQPIARFAVIGDFGDDNQAEADVAALVNSWGVDFIVSVGDNFYGATDGNYADSWQALDNETGKYYHNWIKPYLGSYGSGSLDINRFFPALGNHDWYHLDSSRVYEDYFDLTPYSTSSGNERYYDFVWENIHFFVLSTYGNGLTEYTFPRHNNYGEPDGVTENSIQAQWLQQAMQNADPSHWKIVVTHHAPYSSSSEHGSESTVRWPFKDWGADLVLCGHDHTYERLSSNQLTYIVNGLGGESIYPFGSPVPESQFRYNDDYGAMLFEVYTDSINFKFITRTGLSIDNFSLKRTASDLVNDNIIIKDFKLYQNYPNPFNPSTKISWYSPVSNWQTLRIYDILGNEVITLADEYRNAGSYEIDFNVGRDSSPALVSGIYFYRLQAGDYSATKKMIYLK